MELFLYVILGMLIVFLLYLWAWKPFLSGEFREFMGMEKEDDLWRGTSFLERKLAKGEAEPAPSEVSPPKKRKPRRMTFHVVPGDDGWVVKKAGAKAALETYRLKKDAIEAGKQLAKQPKKGQLVIHKKDGTIQTEYTYGDDPAKTKG